MGVVWGIASALILKASKMKSFSELVYGNVYFFESQFGGLLRYSLFMRIISFPLKTRFFYSIIVLVFCE
jgi:hypothetical protein